VIEAVPTSMDFPIVIDLIKILEKYFLRRSCSLVAIPKDEGRGQSNFLLRGAAGLLSLVHPFFQSQV
jgi:hypothetical protein